MEECKRIFLFFDQRVSSIIVGVFCMHCVFCSPAFVSIVYARSGKLRHSIVGTETASSGRWD